MNLNQITVPVSDLDRSIRYYRTLELLLVVKSDAYARFECPQGNATFSLHLADSVSANNAVIYFELDSAAALEQQAQRLRDAGVAFESLPEKRRWGWHEARLSDPDGHRLCLFHGSSYRKHPPWRLIPNHTSESGVSS